MSEKAIQGVEKKSVLAEILESAARGEIVIQNGVREDPMTMTYVSVYSIAEDSNAPFAVRRGMSVEWCKALERLIKDGAIEKVSAPSGSMHLWEFNLTAQGQDIARVEVARLRKIVEEAAIQDRVTAHVDRIMAEALKAAEQRTHNKDPQQPASEPHSEFV